MHFFVVLKMFSILKFCKLSDKLAIGSNEQKQALAASRSHWVKFLVFKLQLDNVVRLEAFENVTVTDYRNLVSDGDLHQVTVSAIQKTSITQGPNTFFLFPISKRLVDIYLEKVRPSLETNLSEDFLFINSLNGKRLQKSNMSSSFKELWITCGGKEDIGSHFLRHSKATEVEEKCPDEIPSLAKLMKHSTPTLIKSYNLKKGSRKDLDSFKRISEALGGSAKEDSVEYYTGEVTVGVVDDMSEPHGAPGKELTIMNNVTHSNIPQNYYEVTDYLNYSFVVNISESREPLEEDDGGKEDDVLEEDQEDDASMGGEVFNYIIRFFSLHNKVYISS